MDFYHDVRDWLGGHPYESISKRNVLSLVEPLGFKLIDCNVKEADYLGQVAMNICLRKYEHE